MTVPAFLRSRAAGAGALLYLLVSLICTRIPLLDYLGFEFSFVIALVASFQAGLMAVALTGQAYRASDERGTARSRTVLRALLRSTAASLVLLGIPFFSMLANALTVRNCSLSQGAAFFLLLPVVSAVLSSCLGFFCGMHYRRARLAFTAIVLATFVYALGLGYFTPAIFSYNPFYGYFPGLTYDEELAISMPLALSRVLALIAAGVFAWMGSLVARECDPGDGVRRKGAALARQLSARSHLPATLAIVLGAAVVFWFRCDLGFESTGASIRNVLGGEFRTENFDIVYPREAYSSEQIRRVAAEHEFRLHQVLGALSLTARERITSFIYPSPAEKMRLIGAGSTDIAKPWRNELHVTQQSLDATLKHELVHVAAARFGLPVIRASLSTGLVEGLAMAIDWRWGNRTPHQYAAAIRRLGLPSDIRPLMRLTGFAAQSTAASYVQAGSFCRYLIDRYGIRKMMLLYRSGEYETLYGRSLDELNRDWQDFLQRIPAEPNDSACVEALFQHPTIFAETCARVIADRNATARNLMRRRDFSNAGTLFRQSYREGSGLEALGGWLTCELRQQRFEVPAKITDSLLQTVAMPGRYLPLCLPGGDGWWGLGDVARALALYRRLEEADITDRLTLEALLREDALRDAAHGTTFLQFFVAGGSDTVRATRADSLLGLAPNARFLLMEKGETLLSLGEDSSAAAALRSFTWSGADPRLESRRMKLLGRAEFRLGRYQDARASFWLSLNSVSTAAANAEVDDWIERCDWMASHGI